MSCIVRVSAGAAPEVQPKMCGQKLLFSTYETLCWYYEYFGVVVLIAFFSSLREVFACGLKTLTSKKVRLNLEPHNPFDFTSSRLSS